MAEQPKPSAGEAERRTPVVMFNIPEPNPLRGNNILIEMNAPAARALCDVLDDINLDRPEDKPLIAFKKHIRRYYGTIAQQRREREASTVEAPASTEPTAV